MCSYVLFSSIPYALFHIVFQESLFIFQNLFFIFVFSLLLFTKSLSLELITVRSLLLLYLLWLLLLHIILWPLKKKVSVSPSQDFEQFEHCGHVFLKTITATFIRKLLNKYWIYILIYMFFLTLLEVRIHSNRHLSSQLITMDLLVPLTWMNLIVEECP